MRVRLGYAFALLAGFIAPFSASGAVLFDAGAGNVASDQNVLFNAPGLTLTGPVVQGKINQVGLIVTFTGNGENLAGNGGQATVAAADGALRSLSVALGPPGGTFTSLVLNLDAAGDGLVTFTVGQSGGPNVVFTDEDLDAAGQNFFRFTTDNGSLITSVALAATSDVASVNQVRVGGATLVPEPASVALLSLGGLALLRRSRRR